MPEGTNSHTFDPPPSAAAVLSEADLVFVNGLQLEEPTKELAAANMSDGARLVEIGTRVLPEARLHLRLLLPEGGRQAEPAPVDRPDVRDQVRRGGAGPRWRRPTRRNASNFAANAAAFTRQATALSDALRTDQATIPGGRRELLTYHDAYAYFAKTYGWTVIGAIQPKNFEDPTPKEVAALIDQIKAEDVPVIFGSEVFPSEVLGEVGRATGARYEDTLRDDDLPGEPGDPEHSWAGPDALRLPDDDHRAGRAGDRP